MKQLCPSCLKSVEVPESAAGTDYPCLVCGSMIPVPRNYSPSVAVPPPPPPMPAADRPPPPPGLAPPAATPAVPPPVFHPDDVKEIGISISPGIVEWLPAVGLALVFIFSFFAWVGSYPGGHRLFAQNAWEALGASYTPNNVPADLEDVEKKLESTLLHYNWWLLAYVLFLVVALFFAWADRVLPDKVTPTSVPGPLVWLTRIWPSRHGILLVLAVLMLGCFIIQGLKGLGLETALRDYAAARHEEETKVADTDLKKTAARVKAGQEYAQFAVQTTSLYALTFWLHIAIVLGAYFGPRFADRAGRPNPRLALRY